MAGSRNANAFYGPSLFLLAGLAFMPWLCWQAVQPRPAAFVEPGASAAPVASAGRPGN